MLLLLWEVQPHNDEKPCWGKNTDYRRELAIQYLKSQIIRYFSKFSLFIQSFFEFLTVVFKLLHARTTISVENNMEY